MIKNLLDKEMQRGGIEALTAAQLEQTHAKIEKKLDEFRKFKHLTGEEERDVAELKKFKLRIKEKMAAAKGELI